MDEPASVASFENPHDSRVALAFALPLPATTAAAATTDRFHYGTETHQHQQQQQRRRQVQRCQFSCLYTKHKTQKRKTWHDGRIVLSAFGADLHVADPPPGSGDPVLDRCELSKAQSQSLMDLRETRIETEQHLIELQEPWKTVASPTAASTTSVSTTATAMTLIAPSKARRKKPASSYMNKIMSQKFQVPKPFIPPPPGSRHDEAHTILGKRRQPLQPGELLRQHYGDETGAPYHQRPFESSCRPIERQIKYPAQHNPTESPSHLLQQQHRRQQQTQTQIPRAHHGHGSRVQQRHESYQELNPRGNEREGALLDGSKYREFSRESANQRNPNAPDAFSLQPDHPLSANSRRGEQISFSDERQSKTASMFASNEFDAGNFYGMDEEEEENEDANENAKEEKEESLASNKFSKKGNSRISTAKPRISNNGFSTGLHGFPLNRDDQDGMPPVRPDHGPEIHSRHGAPVEENSKQSLNVRHRQQEVQQRKREDSRPKSSPAVAPRLNVSVHSDNNKPLSSNQLLALFGAVPIAAPEEPKAPFFPAKSTENAYKPSADQDNRDSNGGPDFEFVLPPAGDSSDEDSDDE